MADNRELITDDFQARVELERATGQLLNENNISLAEAYKGVVARPPSPLPPASQ